MTIDQVLKEIIRQSGVWNIPEFVKITRSSLSTIDGREVCTATVLFFDEVTGQRYMNLTLSEDQDREDDSDIPF